MATAQVGSGEVGLQRFAVKPHLTGCSVEVLPEGERKVEVVAEIDHAVEGEFQLVVLQELKRRRKVDVRQAGQVDPGGIEMATGLVPAGLKRRAINGHGSGFTDAGRMFRDFRWQHERWASVGRAYALRVFAQVTLCAERGLQICRAPEPGGRLEVVRQFFISRRPSSRPGRLRGRVRWHRGSGSPA